MNETATGFRHVGDRELHVGRVWTAVVGRFESPDGAEFTREIIRSRGAVATVPISFDPDDEGRQRPLVTLIAQYRPAIDRVVVEIPAGTRDVDGEADIDNARRELAEEVGLASESLSQLTVIHPSVGMTDSTCAIFLAIDCTPVTRTPQGAEEDHAEIITIPLVEAIGWTIEGRIADAKTIIGLLLTEHALRV